MSRPETPKYGERRISTRSWSKKNNVAVKSESDCTHNVRYTNSVSCEIQNDNNHIPKECIAYFDSGSEHGTRNQSKLKSSEHVEKLKATPRKSKSTMQESDWNEHSPVTPPKQKKTGTDAESLKTPSSLLKKLSLMSPTKEVNDENSKSDVVPQKNVYKSARRALHNSLPVQLPGREKEIEKLHAFMEKCVSEKKAGSLYISGPPGTGKTASLLNVLSQTNVSFYFGVTHFYVVMFKNVHGFSKLYNI